MFKDENGNFKIILQRDRVTKNNKWRYNDFEGHILYLGPSEYIALTPSSPMKIELIVKAFVNGKKEVN